MGIFFEKNNICFENSFVNVSAGGPATVMSRRACRTLTSPTTRRFCTFSIVRFPAARHRSLVAVLRMRFSHIIRGSVSQPHHTWVNHFSSFSGECASERGGAVVVDGLVQSPNLACEIKGVNQESGRALLTFSEAVWCVIASVSSLCRSSASLFASPSSRRALASRARCRASSLHGREVSDSDN